jgi:hypothetical protein
MDPVPRHRNKKDTVDTKDHTPVVALVSMKLLETLHIYAHEVDSAKEAPTRPGHRKRAGKRRSHSACTIGNRNHN